MTREELAIEELETEITISNKTVEVAIEALQRTSPCDLCYYNPPSGSGKPCGMCPAKGRNK